MPNKKSIKLTKEAASNLINMDKPIIIPTNTTPEDYLCLTDLRVNIDRYWDFAREYCLRKTWNSNYRDPNLPVGRDVRKPHKPAGELLIVLYELLINMHPLWRYYLANPHLFLDAGDWFAICFLELKGTQFDRVISNKSNTYAKNLSVRQRVYNVEHSVIKQLKNDQNPYAHKSNVTALKFFTELSLEIRKDSGTDNFKKLWRKFIKSYQHLVSSDLRNKGLIQINYDKEHAIAYSKGHGRNQPESKKRL